MRNISISFVAFAIVLLMWTSSCEAQSRGRWVSTKISEDSLSIMSLNFVDSNTGYIKALRYTFPNGNGLAYYYTGIFHFRTTDGGMTWTPLNFGKYMAPFYKGGNNPQHFYDDYLFNYGYEIVPVTSTIAYMKAISSDAPTRLVLLKTTNTGSTWTEVNTIGENTVKSLGAFKFFSENIGVASNLLHTIDGGQHWFANTWPHYPNIEYRIDGIDYKTAPAAYPIVFLDNTHFLAFDTKRGFGEDGKSQPKNGITTFLSTDAGFIWTASNWDDSLLPFASKYDSTDDGVGFVEVAKNSSSIFLIPALRNLLTIGDVGSRSKWISDTDLTFYHSSDYASSWKSNHSFDLQQGQGFEATTPVDLWMTVYPKRIPYYYFRYPWAPDWVDMNSQLYKDSVRYWATPLGVYNRISQRNASWIVHSTDGGKKWDIDSFSLRDPEIGVYSGLSIVSTDPNHLWVVAQKDGKSYVFRYKAPEVNAVEEGRDIPPADYPNFINIFPNPANDKVKIALWRNAGIKQIRIFDVLGREISAPTKQLTQSSFELDVSLVAAGPYILVCDIAGGTNVARTIIVRK